MNNDTLIRERCPACHHEEFEERDRVPMDRPPISDYLRDFYDPQGGVDLERLVGMEYVLCECRRCGLIFQREILGPDLMYELYERWLDPDLLFSQQQAQALHVHIAHAQHAATVLDYLGGPPSQRRLLDYGMGWGDWARAAQGLGCEVAGVELSPRRIAHARSLGILVLEPDELRDQSFDFINTEQVFEHLPEPLDTLGQLAQALKPCGFIRISVPDAYDIDRRLKRMDWLAPKGTRHSLNAVAPLEHINCFRRRSILTMAKRVGLQQVFIPLTTQYRNATHWGSPRLTGKNILLPLMRNVLRNRNDLLLARASA